MKNTSLKSVLGTSILASTLLFNSVSASSLFDFEFIGSAGEMRSEVLSKTKNLDLSCGEKAKEDKSKDHKCGEGKCGEKKDKKAEKKEDKKDSKKKEAKTKDAKCGEGKCGSKKNN